PNKLYLISTILDATISNKDISDALIEQDAVLSQFCVNEIMKKWANGLQLTDKRISPINGTIEGLPPVYMFVVVLEMTHPDMKLFEQIM
ncbi:esterase, partial [Staphylococcus aureus]|nr:esterase [Staphylococcus aureus]